MTEHTHPEGEIERTPDFFSQIFLALGVDESGEGVVLGTAPGGIQLPLWAGDMAYLRDVWPLMQHVARKARVLDGGKVRLIRLSAREVLYEDIAEAPSDVVADLTERDLTEATFGTIEPGLDIMGEIRDIWFGYHPPREVEDHPLPPTEPVIRNDTC